MNLERLKNLKNLSLNLKLTSRQKKLAKWIGYPLLAICAFLWTAAHTFPYERLIEQAEAKLAGKGELDVTRIRPGFLPGTVIIDGLNLKIVPRQGQKPVTVYVDKLTVKVGLLAALFRRINLDLEAEVGGGVLNADISLRKSGWEASGTTEEFPLAMLPPGVQQAFGGLPLAGGLTAEFDIEVPENNIQKAVGSATFRCSECTVGDGKAKVQNQPMPGMRQPMAFAEGPTVPRLSLGDAKMDIKLADGKGKLTLSAESPDGALKLDWNVDLAPRIGESKVTGCTRFRLAESLRSRAPNFVNVQMSLTANKEPNGMFALPVHRFATLGNIRMNSREQCAGAGSESRPSLAPPNPSGNAFSNPPRPNLPSIPPPLPPPANNPPAVPPTTVTPPEGINAVPPPMPPPSEAPPPMEAPPPPEMAPPAPPPDAIEPAPPPTPPEMQEGFIE
jgi:type II secretion system protein N